MIRPEHTGTGPLKLIPHASRPAPTPVAPVALPSASVPSAVQDQALLAHVGSQGSSAPVALLEQGHPVHSRVQTAFMASGSGREEVSGVVARLRALPPQAVDDLLLLLDKRQRQQPLAPQEHARLAAALPDLEQVPAVYRQLLRDEMTSDLRRLKVRDPENYNELIFALGDLARRPGTTLEQVETLLKAQGHTLRPTLRSALLLTELPQAVRKAGALTTPTPLRPAAPSFHPTFVRALVVPTFGDEHLQAAVVRANRVAREQALVPPSPPEPTPEVEAQQQEQAEFYAHLLDVARHEPNRLSFADGDVAGLVGVLQTNGGSLGQLLDQRLRKEVLGMGRGESQTPPLDLENRLGYVLGQSLLRYQQPEMAGLAAILAKLDSATARLNPAETDLLRSVGLRFHQGQLYNLGNQQVLGAEERQELQQFATLIQRYHQPDADLLAPVSGGQHMTRHEALGKALATMAQSQLLLAEVTALEEKIAANDAAIRQQNVVYQTSLDQLSLAQQQHQTLLTQIAQGLAQQQALMALGQQLKAGQTLSPQANQILAPLGLQVTATGYQHHGQVISRAEFMAVLAAAEAVQGQTLASLQTQLADSQIHLDRQQVQADQQGAQLQTLYAQQTADVVTYQNKTAALAQADQALGEWAQHPDVGTLLPQAAVSRLRTHVQGALARTPQVIAQAQATLTTADVLLARGRDLAGVSQRLQQQQQELQSALRAALHLREQAYHALRRKLEEEVAVLVAQADQLQAALDLTPLPQGEALAKLLEGWLEDIQSASVQMNAILQQRQNLQQQERLQLAQYVEQAQRGADYHQTQLGKLDQRRTAQVAQLIAATVSALRPTLQAFSVASDAVGS